MSQSIALSEDKASADGAVSDFGIPHLRLNRAESRELPIANLNVLISPNGWSIIV
jgi:hypothetical protein